jgi:hypothetical protein
MVEWSPKDLVSEEELLNRAILQKCWIAWTSGYPSHFNDMEITLDIALDLFTKRNINPHTYREGRMGIRTSLTADEDYGVSE